VEDCVSLLSVEVDTVGGAVAVIVGVNSANQQSKYVYPCNKKTFTLNMLRWCHISSKFKRVIIKRFCYLYHFH